MNTLPHPQKENHFDEALKEYYLKGKNLKKISILDNQPILKHCKIFGNRKALLIFSCRLFKISGIFVFIKCYFLQNVTFILQKVLISRGENYLNPKFKMPFLTKYHWERRIYFNNRHLRTI